MSEEQSAITDEAIKERYGAQCVAVKIRIAQIVSDMASIIEKSLTKLDDTKAPLWVLADVYAHLLGANSNLAHVMATIESRTAVASLSKVDDD